MLTSDKAICEMNTGELAEEYEYCMKSAESEALAPPNFCKRVYEVERILLN